MSKKIIAVDIDGVLADWVGSGVPRLNKILNTSISVSHNVGFDMHRTFGVSKKKMQWAFDELYKDLSVLDLKPVKNARKSIDELHEKYKLIAITARPKKFWSDTEKWIKKYFDKDITVYFGSGAGKPFGGEDHEDNKLALCRKYRVSYLIEDNPAEVLAALKTDTTPLCMAWPWNDKLKNNRKIIRGDWKFLTNYILEKDR
jgi:phosphoglycolate phosphatase-like HAD superfamily hydrolase